MSQNRAHKQRKREKRKKSRSQWRENKREQALIETKGRGFAKMQEMCDVVERDAYISREEFERSLNESEEQSASEEGTPNEEAVS